MKAEHWIAIIGILISAIIAYLTTKATIYAEKRRGKLIILELVKKYLISFNGSWDTKEKQIKKDNITKEQYLRVLEIIETDFKELVFNPYYLDLAFKYPDLTMLQVYISREIAELRNKQTFELRLETLKYFFQLYSHVKGNMRKRYFEKDGQFFQLDNNIEIWKKNLEI